MKRAEVDRLHRRVQALSRASEGRGGRGKKFVLRFPVMAALPQGGVPFG